MLMMMMKSKLMVHNRKCGLRICLYNTNVCLFVSVSDMLYACLYVNKIRENMLGKLLTVLVESFFFTLSPLPSTAMP